MHKYVSQLKGFILAGIVGLSTVSHSTYTHASMSLPAVSPAMIEQLKKLPKAEQQRLMKQYGIAPTMLGGLNKQPLQAPVATATIIKDRNLKKDISSAVGASTNKTTALKPYGYDMFEGEPTTFAPVNDIPVPSEYLMGPGDVINVQMYGQENQSFSLVVSRSGNIDLPNTGPMSVNGLSFETLQQQLSAKINEQYTGVNSNVSLGELRSIRIIIAGEAYKPGSYTVSSLSTITQALFVSGGVSDIASLRHIQLKRAGKTIVNFDLYDLLMKGDASKDARLRSGDVIFIPPVAKTVTVTGEVRRPAIYELKGEETAADLIKLAAGLKANSFPKASVIKRFSNEYLPTLINVDLTVTAGQKIMVSDGDVLKVQSTTNKIKDKILLVGSVNRPGDYQWRKGMRISDLISSQWSDLKGVADLKYALLTREINPQGDIETKQFSLANIFKDNNSNDNLYLQPRDKLIIFSQTHGLNRIKLLAPVIEQLKSQDLVERLTNVASISGEVRFPGEYPISNDMKVSDLIEAAGGVKESAYLKQTELTKFDVTDELGASVIHQQISLNLALNDDEEHNLKVASRDHLTVMKIPAWQENMSVTLKGEVRFPGRYSVRKGETLNDVIERAGGYTNLAYLAGAVFTRESVRKQQKRQIIKLADQLRLSLATKGLSGDDGGVGFSQASEMLKELENIEAVGRMVVSLSTDNTGKHDELTIENGDILLVPEKRQIVTVVGEVHHASTHFYLDNISFDDYIAMAGGIKQRADGERVYIIRANGAVVIPQTQFWFGTGDTIKPGDTIVVPLDTEYNNSLTLWSKVTSILYNTAVALAAMKGL